MIELREMSRQELQALRRLKEPGNETTLRVLSSLVEDAKAKLVRAGDMATVHRLQGRVEAYEDLLRAAEESAEALKRAEGA